MKTYKWEWAKQLPDNVYITYIISLQVVSINFNNSSLLRTHCAQLRIFDADQNFTVWRP